MGVHDDFDAWVAARGPGLLRLAFLLTGDRRDAEDLVQEALSRAYSRWERIVRLEDPDAYVRRMIVNGHTSTWRKFRRRELPFGDVPADHLLAPASDASESADEHRRLWSRRACDCPRSSEQRWCCGTTRSSSTPRSPTSPGSGSPASAPGSPAAWPPSARTSVRAWVRTMADRPLLEDRLRDALCAAADLGPRGVALAAGARARARARRRARVVGGGVALVLGSVPLALAMTTDSSTPDVVTPAPSRTLPDDDVPAGWRVQRWRHVMVQAPNTWGDGHLATWCRRDREPGRPVVERPTGGRVPRSCVGPRLGYGLQFVDTTTLGRPLQDGLVHYRPQGQDALFPPGAWVGVTCGTCKVAVRVVSHDEYVARYVLRTVIATRR